MFPGEKVDASNFLLRVQTADRSHPVTSVRTQLGIESPGTPDVYLVEVFDASGSVFFASQSLECGDIDIQLLP
jgi:hypothetical protein